MGNDNKPNNLSNQKKTTYYSQYNKLKDSNLKDSNFSNNVRDIITKFENISKTQSKSDLDNEKNISKPQNIKPITMVKSKSNLDNEKNVSKPQNIKPITMVKSKSNLDNEKNVSKPQIKPITMVKSKSNLENEKNVSKPQQDTKSKTQNTKPMQIKQNSFNIKGSHDLALRILNDKSLNDKFNNSQIKEVKGDENVGQKRNKVDLLNESRNKKSNEISR